MYYLCIFCVLKHKTFIDVVSGVDIDVYLFFLAFYTKKEALLYLQTDRSLYFCLLLLEIGMGNILIH